MREEVLIRGSESLGIKLSPSQIESFRTYFDMFIEKNEVMNLTSITDETEFARLHFLDCLAMIPICGLKDQKVIDIGTGGGFPGMPLKIAAPDLSVTMLDSTEKKINFIKEVCEKISTEASFIADRAEIVAQRAEYREKFDVCTSRAVARLSVLSELCLPFVKKGGIFVAMKSADSAEEIEEALGAIRLLGGDKPKVSEYTIPGTDIVRKLVIVKKVSETAVKYPRSFAKIKKSPLK